MIEPPAPQPEQRKHSGVAREYRSEQIVVYWEPQVFDNERRPWVDVSTASADQIAEVIQRCPNRPFCDNTHRRTGFTTSD